MSNLPLKPMPFPPSKRVFFRTNPLEEVVCQLRFPTILRIDAEVPVAFQDRIRAAFPLYERSFAPVLPTNVFPPEMMHLLSRGATSTHQFSSADQVWKLSLTRDYLALTTRSYKEWADFKAKLSEPLAALLELYTPSFFARVGLRYRDRIDRDGLGLKDAAWSELLNAEALGELADAAIGSYVEHSLRELVVRLTDDAGRVRVVHGLQAENERIVYIIDADFFSEASTNTKAVGDVLDAFNRRAGNLFRWYVRPRLHAAMLPSDVATP